MLTYARNFLYSQQNQPRTLEPRIAIYYITTHCNLNCTYCEDFGARRNAEGILGSPNDAKKILDVIRSGVPHLWITGGEPLLAPHLLDLLRYARDILHFRSISLITNGTLLADHLAILPLLNRLIISLDSISPGALAPINLAEAQTKKLLGIIEKIAPLQKKDSFKLILNAVITPETLAGMDDLLEFAAKNKILLSFSPQAVNNLPRFDLLASPDYQAFTEKMISAKKRGAPILGSHAYLKTLQKQEPYKCYPTIVPRIMPDGWLIYPCLPMEKEGGELGGRPVNLLDVAGWDEAWRIAKERYGEAPFSCTSCFQQCYAEPSLIQRHPLEWLIEKRRTGMDLGTYAPG